MMHYHAEHLLDRAAMLALRAMLALQPAADLGPEGRPAFDALMEKTPAAEGVTYEAGEVGGTAGWWCRPKDADPTRAILYLHGGAYVVGSPRAYRHFAGQIAFRANTSVFVVEYGLAPEEPFPSAVADAEDAYRGLVAAGFRRIALVGDSAGGGLALVTAASVTAAARHGDLPSPSACIVALSPWTDLALSGASIASRRQHDPLLTREALEAARRRYLGQGDPRDPRASPLYGNLLGLPPVMLHVGEDEILLDDSHRFAESVQAAGGSAEVHVWQGMVHVFPANLALLHAAREALDLVGAFLLNHLRTDQGALAPSHHNPIGRPS